MVCHLPVYTQSKKKGEKRERTTGGETQRGVWSVNLVQMTQVMHCPCIHAVQEVAISAYAHFRSVTINPPLTTSGSRFTNTESIGAGGRVGAYRQDAQMR